MNKIINLGKIKTSTFELIDITKAWLALSLAFAFVFSGFTLFSGNFFINIFSWQFLILFLISLVTAGLGFLLHELGHKFAAQHYGCAAEFRAYDQMLYLALGLAMLIGFIFAAPGAVMISGMLTRKENGIISAAGPLINYMLALIFLGLTFISTNSTANFIFWTGFQINSWLGLFNLIPFGMFDGKKILEWSRYVWGGMTALGIFYVFFFRSLI